MTGNTNENSYNVKDVEVSTIVFMLALCANQIKNILGASLAQPRKDGA